MQSLHLLSRMLWPGVEVTRLHVEPLGVGRFHIGNAHQAERDIQIRSEGIRLLADVQAVARVGHDRADTFDEAYRIGLRVPICRARSSEVMKRRRFPIRRRALLSEALRDGVLQARCSQLAHV